MDYWIKLGDLSQTGVLELTAATKEKGDRIFRSLFAGGWVQVIKVVYAFCLIRLGLSLLLYVSTDSRFNRETCRKTVDILNPP